MQLYTLEELERAAEHAAQSGLYSTNVSTNVAVMGRGQAIGLDPWISICEIGLMKGRMVMSAASMAAVALKTGRYRYEVEEHSDTLCRIAFYSKDSGDWRLLGRSEFTMDHAKAAKLDVRWDKEKRQYVKNEVYEKFPRNLMFARAFSNGARWYLPDIFGGAVYTPDELQDASDEPSTPIDPELKSKKLDRKQSQGVQLEESAPSKPATQPEPKPRRLTAKEWEALKAYPSATIKKWLAKQVTLSPLDKKSVEDIILEKEVMESGAMAGAQSDAEEGATNG